MSCKLSNLTIQRKASLATSTILKEICLYVTACCDSFSLFDNLDLEKLEIDLVGDKLLIVWTIRSLSPTKSISYESDQVMYVQLKRDSDNVNLTSVNGNSIVCIICSIQLNVSYG